MRFEWDEAKNALNRKKHGIGFDAGALVFDDPDFVLVLDRVDYGGEQRWHAIGAVPLPSGRQALLLVVHVYRRGDYGEEIIRIVSAREASKRERRIYVQKTTE